MQRDLVYRLDLIRTRRSLNLPADLWVHINTLMEKDPHVFSGYDFDGAVEIILRHGIIRYHALPKQQVLDKKEGGIEV